LRTNNIFSMPLLTRTEILFITVFANIFMNGNTVRTTKLLKKIAIL